MSAITADMVKDLRERSGAGMMECKKALTESQGDVDKAMKILRERGIAKSAKRADRTAAEGLISVAANADATAAAMVELNCETDFVARNDGFMALSNELAVVALATKAAHADALAPQQLPTLGKTAGDAVADMLAKIGEKINLNRAAYLHGDVVATYIHPPGKIGVVIAAKMDGGNKAAAAETLRNVCMHIAALSPRFLDESEVDAATLETEKEIAATLARKEGKPEAIIPKIVEGKVKAFYKEACLLDNAFAMEPKMTVRQVIEAAAKAAGATITVTRFLRFKTGETAAPAAAEAEG